MKIWQLYTGLLAGLSLLLCDTSTSHQQRSSLSIDQSAQFIDIDEDSTEIGCGNLYCSQWFHVSCDQIDTQACFTIFYISNGSILSIDSAGPGPACDTPGVWTTLFNTADSLYDEHPQSHIEIADETRAIKQVYEFDENGKIIRYELWPRSVGGAQYYLYYYCDFHIDQCGNLAAIDIYESSGFSDPVCSGFYTITNEYVREDT